MVEGSDKPAENQPSPGQNPAIEHAAAQAYSPKDVTPEQHARSARVRSDEQSVNEIMLKSQQGGSTDSQSVGQQIISKISPETASAYMRGQQLQESGRSLTDRTLSHDDREALATYHTLHTQMQNENASYSGNRSLTQVVEDGIKSKQTQYEHQSATPSAPPATSHRGSDSKSSDVTTDATTAQRPNDSQKTPQEGQGNPAWLAKGHEKDALFTADDPRSAQRTPKPDAQTADRTNPEQRQRSSSPDSSTHDSAVRSANRLTPDSGQTSQDVRNLQQRQTDGTRQQDASVTSRRQDSTRVQDPAQVGRNQDQLQTATPEQQRNPTRDPEMRQSAAAHRDTSARNPDVPSRQTASGQTGSGQTDNRISAGSRIPADDQKTVAARDTTRANAAQTPDRQSIAERSNSPARQNSADVSVQARDTRRAPESPLLSERKAQDTNLSGDRKIATTAAGSLKDTASPAARDLQKSAGTAGDTSQSRVSTALSDRTVSLLRQSLPDSRSAPLALKSTVPDTRAITDSKTIAVTGPGGAPVLKGSIEIARQIKPDAGVAAVTLRAGQIIARSPDTGRPTVQTLRPGDTRATTTIRPGDPKGAARSDAGARPAVITSGRAPGSLPSGVETARTFTSAVKITERSPDRRYILGTEIALAAVIAAAGASRQRPDAVTRSTTPETKGGAKPPEVKPPDIRTTTGRTNDTAAARATDARAGGTKPAAGNRLPDAGKTPDGRPAIPVQRPDSVRLPSDRSIIGDGKRVGRTDSAGDKRFITGAEIALAAVIASAGTSRVRGERAGDTKPGSETIKGQKNEPQAGEPRKQEPGGLPGRKNDSVDSSQAHVRPPDKTGRTQEPDKPGRRPEPDKGTRGDAQTDGSTKHFDEPDAKEHHDSDDLPAFNEDASPAAEVTPTKIGSTLPELIIQNSESPNPPESPKEVRLSEAEQDLSEELTRQSAAGSSKVLHRPTVLMAASDTLVTLAEAYFHDPNLAWLIADLNKDHISETWIDGKRVVELKSRQQISLPVWDDIVEFYNHRPQDSQPENLVTIVQQTQVDLELLNSRLGVAMGVPSPATPHMVPAPQSAVAVPSIPRFSFSRFLTRPRIADG